MSGHVVIKPAQDNKNEHYYHALLYTLLVAFGADIHAEEPSAKGCSDLTLKMPKGIYVMEITFGDTVNRPSTKSAVRATLTSTNSTEGPSPKSALSLAARSAISSIGAAKPCCHSQEKATLLLEYLDDITT